MTIDGRRDRKSLDCSDKQIAIEKAVEISKQIESGQYHQGYLVKQKSQETTVAEFVAIFWKRQRVWNQTTRERYAYTVAEYISTCASRSLASITAEDVENWLQVVRERGCKTGTINRYMRQIKTIYRLAVEWGYLIQSPVSKLEEMPEATLVPDALSEDELHKLLAELSRESRQISILLAETGLRWGELSRLPWSDIDLDKRNLKVQEVHVEPGKAADFRVIPLTQWAVDTLREIRAEGRIPFVITVKTLRKGMKTAAQRAGIKHVHPHMLRHTFATRLRDRGVPLDRIKELLGHKDLRMTLRYAKARPEQLREAIRMLEGQTRRNTQ